MKVYRVSRRKYADSLSGMGAMLYGGRWNSRGHSAIYTAQNISLAKLEVTVHLDLDLIPNDYCLTTIKLKDDCLIKEVFKEALPKNWNLIPSSYHSQSFGDAFLNENKFFALKVPSAIVPQEFNFILNPHHSAFKDIKITNIEEFYFDNRLFKN